MTDFVSNNSLDTSLQTPILLIIYNRPRETEMVLQAIREVQPLKLYIAGDGPKHRDFIDKNKVDEARRIVEKIDWPCQITVRFSEENRGCKWGVSSAITWFFENETEGIILEDDCLPNRSFFFFCEEMLFRFRNDTRIMHIGGTNPLWETGTGGNSYKFTRYNRIWGWASWRRSWDFFDPDIEIWPSIRSGKTLKNLLGKSAARRYKRLFDAVYSGKLDTWDYQWFLSRLMQGLSIVPDVNLVSNIGFGEEATHTKFKGSKLSNLVRADMSFPLDHPKIMVIDYEGDREWAKRGQIALLLGHFLWMAKHWIRRNLKNSKSES